MRRTNRGSILVTILFMTSILALLVAAIASDSFQSMKSVSQSGRDTQAKYAAYAGLEMALNRLRQNEMFIGEEIEDRHGRIEASMLGLGNLRYEVLLWNNIQERDEQGKVTGDAPEDLEGPDGVIVRPDTVYIVSSGKDITKGEEVLLSSMAGTARRIRPVFEDAAYARTKLALSGSESLVDAWDSKGGWEPYVAGKFPGDVDTGGGGGGDGHGHHSPTPNVVDYEASLGTDSSAGRTLRLLNGARLNGHYRVGPGVSEGNAFGPDGGTTTYTGGSGGDGGTSEGGSLASGGGGDGGGSSETSYAVTTAESETQVAGLKPTSGTGLGDEKAVVDTKVTEVPNFVSPYSEDDVVPGPTLNNSSTVKKDDKGDVVKDHHGNPIIIPPAPVPLAPGGYASVNVPHDQTLQLHPGVYFFRDELRVNGGNIITAGNGPVIVFIGKKATFIDAKVNHEGRASSLQLCFTDGIKDEEELTAVAEELDGIFDGTSGSGLQALVAELNYKNLLSPPLTGEEVTEEEGPKREGFSKLEVSGSTKLYGSISGKNLVAIMNGGDVYGSIMGNVIKGTNTKIHQDLALKGSNLMTAGGWRLEGVHQVR